MFRIGVATSVAPEPRQAGKAAAQAALKRAGAGKCDLALVFATTAYDPVALLGAARKVLGEVPLGGCAGAGVTGPGVRKDAGHAVSVLVLESDELRARTAAVQVVGNGGGSARAGVELARALGPLPADAVALLLFADGLAVDLRAVRSSLLEGLGGPVPLAGGGASFQLRDDQVLQGAVTGVLLSGHGSVRQHVAHGFAPLGRARTVTRCEGTALFELSGEPVLAVLEQYLGPEVLQRPGAPLVELGLALEDGAGLSLVHAVDPARGLVRCSAPLRPGMAVRLAWPEPGQIRAGQEALARDLASQSAARRARLVLHVESVARVRGGGFTEDEKGRHFEAMQAACAGAPWIGFYGLSELGPAGCHDGASVLTVLE